MLPCETASGSAPTDATDEAATEARPMARLEGV